MKIKYNRLSSGLRCPYGTDERTNKRTAALNVPLGGALHYCITHASQINIRETRRPYALICTRPP